MALAKFDEDVCDLLVGVSGLVKGTDLFFGPERPPDRAATSPAVFCTSTSGEPSRHYRGPTEVRRPSARVLIRSSLDENETGLTLARLVLETLHRNPPTGYIELESLNSDPNPLGNTEDGFWRWSVNVLGTKDEAT